MLRIVLCVFLLAMFHNVSSQQVRCPPGQTRFCGCERRCADGNLEDAECPGGVCTVGCYCQFPMFLSRSGNCVSILQCLAENAEIVQPQGPFVPGVGVSEGEGNIVCLGNRLFTNCATCEVFCVQRNNPPTCFLPCREDCFCPSGFVVNDTGHCIAPELCPVDPPTIPPTVITTRATTPPTTLPPPLPGVTDPFVSGVPVPRVCGEREVTSDCVRCERTCANRHLNLPCGPEVDCVTGCACRDGLLRFGNDCVYVNECPIFGVEAAVFCGRVCPEGQFCRRRDSFYVCTE